MNFSGGAPAVGGGGGLASIRPVDGSCRHLVEEPCSLCAIFHQRFILNDHTDVDDNEACGKQVHRSCLCCLGQLLLLPGESS